ncbi:START domain-containing protein [Flocculibacter collagenilyticus]|uniref:START domain-containing protein n=1 Tax=Flocculibacter collagenilyticus TaxID=2744479 RepID=UPI0018F63B2B|nr:START domain-containing protein [Flocculibacter collagenilyticus]
MYKKISNAFFQSALLLLILCKSPNSLAETASGWSLYKETESITVWYQPSEKNKSLYKVKAETRTNASLSAFVNLLNDVSNATRWIDNVQSVTVLQGNLINNNDKAVKFENIVHTKFNAIWPVSERDMVTHSIIEQDKESKVVIIHVDDWGNRIAQEQGYVRMKHVTAKWSIVPAENGQVIIRYVGFADPAGNVPLWLVNRFALISIYNTFVNLTEQVKSANYQTPLPYISDVTHE